MVVVAIAVVVVVVMPASQRAAPGFSSDDDDDGKAARRVAPRPSLPSLLGPRAGVIFGETKFQLPTVAQITWRKRSLEGVAIDKGPGNGR